MKQKAVFLDRDGIITQSINGEAPQEPKDLKLIPQIIPVVKKIKELGFLIIVVSNQPDIALGKINEKTKKELEKKFLVLLKKKHLKIDRIYYCHHHTKGVNLKYSIDCTCQKPKPGMILKAISKFNIDISKSFIVGDRASDVKAGKLAGVKTILFDRARLQDKHLKKHQVKPDYTVNSLTEVTLIINPKVAFILAAGKGSRMLPLTKNIPKPLLKINTKPMIDYVLNLSKAHSFTKIGINLSYLGQKIEDHLGREDFNFVYEKNPTGTAGGILAISKKLKPDSPFLVISSDMMVNFDLSKIYDFHLKNRVVATICCYFRPKSKLVAAKSGQVIFDRKTKIVKKIIERSEKIFSNWVNSSVYIFSPEVLRLIPENGSFDISKDLIPKLLKLKKQVFAYPVNRKKYYQLGIDTPERIKQVEEDIQLGKFRL